jgi:multidrug efflux system membrane fusion protein
MTIRSLQGRARFIKAGIAMAVALACLGGAGVLFSHGATAEPVVTAAPQAIPVSVAMVQARDVSVWDEYSGRLEAVERVEVRSRVSGAVQAVHFREGTLVKQGELLVSIDPAPYAAEVERAQAQVAAAQARVAYTTSERERAQRLWDERAIAQRELDERLNAAREADANLRAAQAALQAAKLNLDYTQVRAPVAGRVGKIEVTVGNLVAAGPSAPVLTTLVSVSPIYASFDVDEQVVARALKDLRTAGQRSGTRLQIERIPVRLGTAATDDTPLVGQLQLINNQVDARSGTVRLRAMFDNADGGLMPGQFARLRMGQARAAQALLVNERAVGTDQDKKFVLVVGDDNQLSYREVVLGAVVDGLRIVERGLQPHERIVVNGLQRVRPGAVVAPEVVPMDVKAELATTSSKQS